MTAASAARPRDRRIVLWSGEAIRLLASFAVLALLARSVTPETLGTYLAITSLALVAPRLLDAGLPHALGYFLRVDPTSLRSGAIVVARHVALALPLALLAAYALRFVPFSTADATRLAETHWLQIGLLISSELAILLGLGTFIPTERFKSYVLTALLPPALFIAWIVPRLRAGFSADQLLDLLLATSLCGTLAMASTLALAARGAAGARFPTLAAYSYGLRSYGSALGKIAGQRFDRLFLVTVLGAAGYAQYSLAISIRDVAIFPANLYAMTLRNRQTDLIAQKADLLGARDVLLRTSLVALGIGLLGALLMYSLWGPVVRFGFGSTFSPTSDFMKVVAFSCAPMAIMGFSWNHLYALRLPGRVTFLTWASLLAAFPIFLVFIATHGAAAGVALSVVVWSAATAATSLAWAMTSRPEWDRSAAGVVEPAHLGRRYQAGATMPELAPVQADARRRLADADRPEDWEAPRCLCGAGGGRILTDVDRYGLPYRKLLCTQCGLLRVTPRWTAAKYGRYYADDYRDLYSPLGPSDGGETVRRLADGPGARLVAAFVEDAWRQHGRALGPTPVIVEIGAGGGWNLSRLDKRWVRIGFDADERFLELGRTVFGVDMRRGFIAEALPALAGADCILLSHVLEHVADPVATLREVCAAARPDALVLVEVPGIFRLHKTSLDPMRYWQNAHTFTFCARSAVDTCRRAGLEPLSVDEWIRLVLRPSSRAVVEVRPNPQLAPSIERYLRYCEVAHRLAVASERLPAIGRPVSMFVRRSADALVRIANVLGWIRGMRSGATALRG
jgi:O-antigen/teichoic acid export membrane protein/SAM-dependent methyltransferase